MSFWNNLFGTAKKADMPIDEDVFVDNNPPDASDVVSVALDKPTLDWVLEFLDTEMEDKGFLDAHANSDIAYRDETVQGLWGKISLKILRSREYYEGLLSESKSSHQNCKSTGMLDTLAKIESHMEVLEDKLEKLEGMSRRADQKQGEGLPYVKGYIRGFNRGVATLSSDIIKNHIL